MTIIPCCCFRLVLFQFQMFSFMYQTFCFCVSASNCWLRLVVMIDSAACLKIIGWSFAVWNGYQTILFEDRDVHNHLLNIWIFFNLDLNIFNFRQMKKHLRNHPKGQTFLVLTVGWPSLFSFVVEDWKSDFFILWGCKLAFFPILCNLMLPKTSEKIYLMLDKLVKL